uniref:T4 RNA ligase 1-like N-terminal domain-containing protein n=1 Tax=viral metagenome TaxID=1070528 RepID=A0A6C0HHQ3_9ZZZZ
MQIENKGEQNNTMKKYATYPLFPEDSQFSKRYVSTKICVSPKANYAIYNYDKTILSSLDTIHDKYRSVVFSYPENKLLSFSPPKSTEYCEFVKKYPKITNTITATEKIEGISINLFYDSRIKSWEISTKTNIGGNYWYFLRSIINTNYIEKSSTFHDMFLDALIHPRNTPLNDNPWISELSKHYCYSFVLQHPENQIIIPIKSPKLWLVAVYEIHDNCAIHIPSNEYKQWPVLTSMVGVIDFPRALNIETYEDLQKYVSKYIQYPFRLSKGIVLWNETTGERTLLNNPNYVDLVKLRTLSPGGQYEYLCIKRVGKLTEYMEYFPQNKKLIMTMEKIYTDFVKTLHMCYMNVYVYKTELLNNINLQFRPHVENLHKTVYLPTLHTRNPVKINKAIVREYIDKMEPREQLFIFSYLRRERDTYWKNII